MSLTWPRSRTLGTARDHAVRIVVALIVGKYEPNPGVEWRTQVVLRPVRHEPSGTSSKTAHCRRCSVPHNPAVDRDVREHLARGERYDEARIYGAILPNDVTLDDVIATAGGIDRPSQAWGTLLKSRIKTPDGRIDLAPPDYATYLPGALDGSIRTDDAFRFLLISGYRKLRSFNSWTHNMPSRADKLDEPRALLHPEAAAALDIADGDLVEITTCGGSLQLTAQVNDRIRRDIIAVPQFRCHTYAAGQTHARARPGVNMNRRHTTDDRDRHTGMPVFNGRPCKIRRKP